jgi:Protein of unknown function (DUF2795)
VTTERENPSGQSSKSPPDHSYVEGSTPVGMDHDDVEGRSLIARHLGRAAFPGTREELVARAGENQAPGHVVDQLRRLPDETFENVQHVMRALGAGTEQQRQ